MSRIFLFPGQGSQYLSMGKSLASAFEPAKHVFEEVNDALGLDLSKIMWEGPEDILKLTENAQPALMAHSMAVIKTLKANGKKISDIASYVAGHSLGEYSALCAAGTFSIADTAKLLKIRGQAMQKAVPVGEGAMAAIIGLAFDDVRKICNESSDQGVVVLANDNGGGQVVISGKKNAVEKAAELAKELGAKRGLLLPVSAPFHSPLMQPAAHAMADALEHVTLQTPSVPVISNVTALPTSDCETIKHQLIDQVCGSVRWRETVESLAGLGINKTVECGAGKVLTGLGRRIDKSLSAVTIQEPEDLEKFAADL